MSGEIPSPAGSRRQAEPSRDGVGKPPWESALYEAVRALERRVAEAERERDELIMKVHVLTKRLGECRGRLDNWELRRQSWGRERAELLKRLERRG